MLPPAYHNYFGQLASLGLQMSRFAGVEDLSAAVAVAREALSLLKSEPAVSERLAAPVALQTIEQRLSGESEDLKSALQDLSRLIQSLGTSTARPFLFVVQNAPDQLLAAGASATKAPQATLAQGELRKTSLCDELIRHWEKGEHAKARDLLTYLLWSARDGNLRSLSELIRVVTSDHAAVSINASAIVEVFEAVGWTEFTLKFIDPMHSLLLPGFEPARRNSNLLIRLLGNPPADARSADALKSALRGRPRKDLWGLRKHAAQGLFALTSPSCAAVLPVADFWKTLIESWPVPVPVLRPSFFGPSKDHEARWDLYEEHARTAFSIAENREQPLELRRDALASIWKGYDGLDSAARPLWTVAYFRSRDLARNDGDFGWVKQSLRAYEKDAGIAGEPEDSTAPAEEPLRLLGRFASFTRSRARRLRVVSDREDGFGASPLENLEQLTAVAQALGTYGLHLEDGLVSSVMKTALDAIAQGGGLDRANGPALLEAFRCSLYPLNPAAAVSAWLDATGLPWPSHRLEGGHRFEGALALLRWLRDRENEPEEIKRETAHRYWTLGSRFSVARWEAVRTDVDLWWHHRLTQEFPAALASQWKEAEATGTPRFWLRDLERLPEAEKDIRAFAQSTLPGTRALAQTLQKILSVHR